MKTNQTMWRSLASLAGIACLGALGWAQTAPPATPPPAAPAAPEAQAEEPEEKEIPVQWNSYSIGYYTHTTGGSRTRLGNYGSIPSGVTLRELKLFVPGDGLKPYSSLIWRGSPYQDYASDGLLITDQGHSILRFSLHRVRYTEPSWSPVDDSEDRTGTASFEQTLAPNFGVFFTYRGTERDQQFTAPRDGEHSRSTIVAGGIEGSRGSTQAGAVLVERRYKDDTGQRPNSLQRELAGHVTTDISPSFSLTGAGSTTSIEQAGRASGTVKTLSLAGNIDLGPLTMIQFNSSRDNVDLGDVVANVYDQRRFSTSVRLIQRLRRWNLQLGYRHREVERVRADRAFVDVPKWNTYDARLSNRFRNGLRLTVRGSWDDLTAAAVAQTEDPRQLQWDDRAFGQIKVDGGGERFNGYASYSYKFLQIRARDVEVGTTSFALGGSYVFTPKILGYAEWAYDTTNAKGVAEATGESLDDFFPTNGSISLGIDWTRTDKDSVSASLHSFGTHNSRGTQLTLQYQRQLSERQSLSVMLAPWRYDDRLYGLTGYRTTLASVNCTVKF